MKKENPILITAETDCDNNVKQVKIKTRDGNLELDGEQWEELKKTMQGKNKYLTMYSDKESYIPDSVWLFNLSLKEQKELELYFD